MKHAGKTKNQLMNELRKLRQCCQLRNGAALRQEKPKGRTLAPRNFHKTIALICLGLVCSLTGCVTLATDCRKQGFNIIQRGFVSLEKSPGLHEVVLLKNVKVHIVGHRSQFNWDRAAAYGSPVAGYANRKNEIWLFGRIVEGKIILNQAVLGHELNHLLNFKDPKIANPDRLDVMARPLL